MHTISQTPYHSPIQLHQDLPILTTHAVRVESHGIHILVETFWRLAEIERRHPTRFGLQSHHRAFQVHVHRVERIIWDQRTIGSGHADAIVVDFHGFPNGIGAQVGGVAGAVDGQADIDRAGRGDGSKREEFEGQKGLIQKLHFVDKSDRGDLVRNFHFLMQKVCVLDPKFAF